MGNDSISQKLAKNNEATFVEGTFLMTISVLQLVPSSTGGGATHVRDLALGLDSTEFDVRVAMPEDSGSVTRADFENLPFHPVSIESGFSFGALRALRKLCRDVDIVHVHGARAAYIGRLANIGLKTKLVYSVHGFTAPHYRFPKSTVLIGIEKTLAPLTDLMITVSHAEDRNVVAGGINVQNRQVVWYGVDLERFQRPTKSKEEVRKSLGVLETDVLLSIVCRLFYPRDFDTLLRAIRHISFQQVVNESQIAKLLIVGDGPWHDDITEKITQLGLQEHVILAGRRRDIPDLLAASDVYVLTSTGGDGMPISIMEAMAAGLPVVATDSDGIPEEVLHEETGLLVKKGDVRDLANALRKVVDSADLRQKYGSAGQKYANENFARHIMVEKIADCYRQLMA